MSVQSEVSALLQGLQDPRLRRVASLINQKLETIVQKVEPMAAPEETLTRRAAFISVGGISATLTSPSSFTVTSLGDLIRFDWDVEAGALLYEIRKGVDWDTAVFQLRTSVNKAYYNPATIPVGNTTFVIKSLNYKSEYSTAFTSITLVVPPLAIPVVSHVEVGNVVLLTWPTPASTFDVSFYIAYRDGVILGKVLGNFLPVKETVSGTFTYSIVAVDIAGNQSPIGSATVTIVIPAYDLDVDVISTFSGTLTDVLVI
jgi:hypothetical protein